MIFELFLALFSFLTKFPQWDICYWKQTENKQAWHLQDSIRPVEYTSWWNTGEVRFFAKIIFALLFQKCFFLLMLNCFLFIKKRRLISRRSCVKKNKWNPILKTRYCLINPLLNQSLYFLVTWNWFTFYTYNTIYVLTLIVHKLGCNL